MTKLSKEKKIHLTLVAVVTVAIIAGLWFGLIGAQQNKIRDIARQSASLQSEMAKEQKVVVESPKIDLELKEATNNLDKIESAMPTGDLFSWTVGSLKQFNTPSYKVEMPQIGSPVVADVRMLPNFPYREAVVAVSGAAYYYDFGKFLADLENRFPYLRVQNLSLEPGQGATAEDHEKLTFRMELVSLVKSNNP